MWGCFIVRVINRKDIMKKTILMLLLIMPVLLMSTSIRASEDDNKFKTSIGRSIDIVNGDLSSEIIGMPILQSSYYENYPVMTELRASMNQDVISTNTYNNVESFISNTWGITGLVGGTYKLFTGSLAVSYSETITNSVSTYESQYYYYNYKIVERYIAYMQDTGYNNELLKLNLHPTFISYLQAINNGTLSYEEFFQLYGTHLIRNAIFGGKMVASTGVYSNEIAVGSTYMNTLTTSLAAEVQFTANASIDVSTAVTSALSSHSGAYIMNSNLSVYGGVADTNPVTWVNSINDENSRMVAFTSNSLIPLWDLLPSGYSHLVTPMKNAFDTYYNSVNNENNIKMRLPSVTQRTESKNSIATTYTITDSGRFNQSYDVINLEELFDTPVSELINLGYTKIKVVMNMQYAEKDDGYQYVYIYNGTNSTSSLMEQFDLEHSPGVKDTTYKLKYIFSNVHNLNNFSSDILVVRFGASGTGDDTWYNKNRTYSITIYK